MFRSRTGWTLAALPLAFVMAMLLLPLLQLVSNSVRNENVAKAWPRTAATLLEWDGQSELGDDFFSSFGQELVASFRDRRLFPISTRLNYERPGLRSTLIATARSLSRDPDAAVLKSDLLRIHNTWGDLTTWKVIRRNVADFTDFYYLAAFDRARDADGDLTLVPDDRRIYIETYARTFFISAVVALICLVLAYPVAITLVFAPTWVRSFLLFLVLIPFWTSALVRTVAWVAILQRNGIVNDLLLYSGLTHDRLQLIFNRPGLLIAMVHVLLPFMILPLYGVISRIDTTPLKAAISLGARPSRAFLDAFAPSTLPGAVGGVLLVFILSIGFYITPELIGGTRDQMITQLVAKYTNELLNWEQAAALSIILLLSVVVCSLVYTRLTGDQ
jgi:putative spermidine/putrescine transport system permease protein